MRCKHIKHDKILPIINLCRRENRKSAMVEFIEKVVVIQRLSNRFQLFI